MKNFRIKQSITDRQDLSLNLYFKDVSKLPMISQEEETQLAEKAQKGDEKAMQELVIANLRFVISVAKQYQGKGLPLVDLIQEGSLGCLQAARTFDPTRGFRFISYAVWWIRQAIIKAITDQCRTVRIPMSQIVNMNKINKVSEKFEQLNYRKPSVEELEEQTELEASKINSAISAYGKSISLESPLSDDDVNCLLDIIPDDRIIPFDENMIKDDTSNIIESILKRLPYRDRDVIRMYYGIGMPAMNENEIGIRFGLCAERVKQIRQNTIKYIQRRYGSKLKKLVI